MLADPALPLILTDPDLDSKQDRTTYNESNDLEQA